MALVSTLTTLKISGFTLIELLIVMTLIGLVVVVVVSSYTSSLRRGRDGRAVADIQELQKALELYRSSLNTYPNNLSVLVAGGNDTYLRSGRLPLNPSDHVIYRNYQSTGVDYCLCTFRLEKLVGGNARLNGAGNFSCNQISYQSEGDYFCVENVQ